MLRSRCAQFHRLNRRLICERAVFGIPRLDSSLSQQDGRTLGGSVWLGARLSSSRRTKSRKRRLQVSSRAPILLGCCRAQSQLLNEHLFVLGLVRSAFQHSETDVECVSALGNAFQHSEWGVKIEKFEKFYFLLFRFP